MLVDVDALNPCFRPRRGSELYTLSASKKALLSFPDFDIKTSKTGQYHHKIICINVCGLPSTRLRDEAQAGTATMLSR